MEHKWKITIFFFFLWIIYFTKLSAKHSALFSKSSVCHKITDFRRFIKYFLLYPKIMFKFNAIEKKTWYGNSKRLQIKQLMSTWKITHYASSQETSDYCAFFLYYLFGLARSYGIFLIGFDGFSSFSLCYFCLFLSCVNCA